MDLLLAELATAFYQFSVSFSISALLFRLARLSDHHSDQDSLSQCFLRGYREGNGTI